MIPGLIEQAVAKSGVSKNPGAERLRMKLRSQPYVDLCLVAWSLSGVVSLACCEPGSVRPYAIVLLVTVTIAVLSALILAATDGNESPKD